ncbi:MAG: DUF4290 domain-containing protein [Tunicatimonas sp.]
MHHYNSVLPPLTLREYGRNIQMLADHLGTVEDREKRTKYAYTLVNLMRQLNPSTTNDPEETTQKTWDDLFIMTNFTLDVDAPFPAPAEDILTKKPERMSYNKTSARYKHYGQNVEKLIALASEIEDEDEQRGAIIYLGKLMKTFYTTWNRDNVDDTTIVDHLNSMSKGKLVIDVNEVKAKNLFDSAIAPSSKGRTNSNNNNNSGKSNKGRRNNRRKKNN